MRLWGCHVWHTISPLACLWIRPRVGIAGDIVIWVHLIRGHLMKFSVIQRQGLLHHHWCKFLIPAAGLMVGIANSMVEFVINQLLAVVDMVYFIRNYTENNAS